MHFTNSKIHNLTVYENIYCSVMMEHHYEKQGHKKRSDAFQNKLRKRNKLQSVYQLFEIC